MTGVPGTGKSTVSKQLVARLGGMHLDIGRFAVEKDLVERIDGDRDTKIVDMIALKSEISKLIDTVTTLIIDGHYSSELVESRFVTKVFVLRRAPWVLQKELKLRGYSQVKVRENVEAELVGSCLQDALDHQEPDKVCELDTTYVNAEETVEQITSILRGEKECLHGLVDWMSDPRIEKLLRES